MIKYCIALKTLPAYVYCMEEDSNLKQLKLDKGITVTGLGGFFSEFLTIFVYFDDIIQTNERQTLKKTFYLLESIEFH